MATGFLDFSSEDAGADAIPTDWAVYEDQGWNPGTTNGDATTEGSLWGITADNGGKQLFVSNEAGRMVGALMWTGGPSIQNGEMYAVMKVPTLSGTGFSTPAFGVIFRGAVSGTSGTGGGGVVNGLSFGFTTTSIHLSVLSRDGSGTWDVPTAEKDTTNLRVAAATHGFTAGSRVAMRVNFNGEALKLRYWDPAGTEPETWGVEHTETGLITAAGAFGFGGVTGDSTAGNDDAWFLEAIGWSDDPAESAPTSAGGGGGGGAPGGIDISRGDRFADRGRVNLFKRL